MRLTETLAAMSAKGKCKVGVWVENNPTLDAEILENIEQAVPIHTIYRAVKLIDTQADFADKTFIRHYTKACQC